MALLSKSQGFPGVAGGRPPIVSWVAAGRTAWRCYCGAISSGGSIGGGGRPRAL